MATDESNPVNDVPTLRSIVTTGDESVIQTKRIGHQLEHEMDENLGSALSQEIIRSMATRAFAAELGVETQAANEDTEELATLPDTVTECELSTLAQTLPSLDMDDTLECLIDEIVDRHITSLRQDIRLLLERVRADS